jgi:hypothetical protein
VADLVRRYEDAGVDQVIFVMQAGPNRHEHICESLELFAREVMPAFVEGREEREKEKSRRLEPAVEAALARREPPHTLTAPYVIDEQAEVDRARRSRRRPVTPRQIGELALEQGRRAARGQAVRLLARFVSGASDQQIERRFGSAIAQRAMFSGMARSFEPDAAAGFQGSIVYELARPATGADATRWTIEVLDGHASARPGGADDAKLTVTFELADFMRMAAGEIDPAEPLLADRAMIEGDLSLATRLPEMFGAPSPY